MENFFLTNKGNSALTASALAASKKTLFYFGTKLNEITNQKPADFNLDINWSG